MQLEHFGTIIIIIFLPSMGLVWRFILNFPGFNFNFNLIYFLFLSSKRVVWRQQTFSYDIEWYFFFQSLFQTVQYQYGRNGRLMVEFLCLEFFLKIHTLSISSQAYVCLCYSYYTLVSSLVYIGGDIIL